jgi:hypothetical protein
MFEGRIISWDRLELKIQSSVSKSVPSGTDLTADVTHEGFLKLWNAPNYGSSFPEDESFFGENPFAGWTVFMEMSVAAQLDPNTSGYTISIPDIGFSYSGTSTYSDTVSARLEIDDYKLYVHTDGTWRLRIGEIRFYFNASLIATDSTGYTLDAVSVLNPFDMPFLALYPQMGGSVAAGCGQGFPSGTPFTSVPFDWDITCSADQTISGGLRFMEDSSWYALPIAHITPVYPTLTGGCEDPSAGSVSGLDTWDVELHGHYSFRQVGAFCTAINPNTTPGTARIDINTWQEVDSSSASAWIWPNLERAINRATGDDYRALWFRYGMPWATMYGHKYYNNYIEPFPTIPPDEEGDEELETEVYPDHTQMLSTVGNSSHTIEDPLSETLYMPITLGGGFTRTQNPSDSVTYNGIRLGTMFPIVEGTYTGLPPDCPNPAFDPPDACDAGITFIWPYKVQKQGDSLDQIAAVFGHPHPYVRLWSTWWNPHWSYALWFYPDDSEVQWQIQSADAAAKAYWLLIAQQHLAHASLPEGENIGTRNFVLAEPLDFSGLRDLTETNYFGQWTSWIGISRWTTIEPTIPTAKALDDESEDAWSMEDGSLSFGSTITINPDGTGSGTAIVELDIGRFLDSAYQYPYLCKKVFLDWPTTNIDEVRVYLESYSGVRKLLEATPGDGFTTPNQEYTLVSNTDPKYGGSWGQDFGAGFLADEGDDEIIANGISAALMADSERLFNLGLHTLRHGVKLRFEIDVTDLESNVQLEYPEWRMQAEDPEQVVETASTSCLLFEDGPGDRFGQWSFWDYVMDAFAPTPLIRAPGNRMSALDALCLKRTVFEGIAPSDGLDTEIGTIYEVGIEYTLRAHLARDPIEQRQTTMGMLWHGATKPALLFAISSLREPPPLAGFPFRARSNEWLPSGDHAQISYSFCVEPRRYIKQGEVPIHVDDGAGDVWTTVDTAPTGWSITKHSHEVDGTEDLFRLVVGTRHIANGRPWHGYFGTTADTTGEGANPWNLLSSLGQYHRTNVEEGDVWYRRATFSAPFGGFEQEAQITESGDCSHPRMEEDGRPVLYLVYISEANGLCIRASSDEGTSFGSETVLIAGAHFGTISRDPLGTLVALGFVYNSGTSGPGKIKMRRKGPGDASWSSAVNIQSGGSDLEFEPDTFHVSYDMQGPGRWVLVCKISGETDLSEWYSTDECETFKEVT